MRKISTKSGNYTSYWLTWLFPIQMSGHRKLQLCSKRAKHSVLIVSIPISVTTSITLIVSAPLSITNTPSTTHDLSLPTHDLSLPISFPISTFESAPAPSTSTLLSRLRSPNEGSSCGKPELNRNFVAKRYCIWEPSAQLHFSLIWGLWLSYAVTFSYKVTV